MIYKLIRWVLGIILFFLIASAPEEKPKKERSAQMAHQFEQSPLEGRDFVYYRLQPGDNLTVLERKFRITSADSILKLNPDLDSERLPVNREIKIPLQ